MQTQIIIVTGKAQAGKDTTCDAITEYLAYAKPSKRVEKFPFAAPLKEFCHSMFNVPREWMYGTNEDKQRETHITWGDLPFEELKVHQLWRESRKSRWGENDENYELPLTVRELLQIFGSNICRAMYPDCWANATLSAIQKSAPDVALISDARFPNELDVFRPLSPLVIKLTRNILKKDHFSETALDNYDFWKFDQNLIYIQNDDMTVQEKNTAVIEAVRSKLWI